MSKCHATNCAGLILAVVKEYTLEKTKHSIKYIVYIEIRSETILTKEEFFTMREFNDTFWAK